MVILEPQIPNTYEEAMASSESHLWRKAIGTELDSMAQQQAWTVVPRTNRTVGCRWVFVIKRDEYGEISQYKARLVAQGFSQRPGIDFDEVYAPVMRYDSLRLLLALAVQHGWTPMQLDVKAAFLYGELKEDIYMELPPGYDDQKGQKGYQDQKGYLTQMARSTHCVKLHKSIYGLKQSPREWYAYWSKFLQEYGLKSSPFDPCVFTNEHDVRIHNVVSKLTKALKDRFQLSEAGQLHFLLGIQITQEKDSIIMSQRSLSPLYHRIMACENGEKETFQQTSSYVNKS